MSEPLQRARFEMGPLMTNCYVIWDPEELEGIVVDPGARDPHLVAFLEERSLRIQWIVNTHAHVDHVAGNAFLHKATQAPICLHEAERSALEQMEFQAALFNYPCEPSPAPARTLKEGDRIQVGSGALSVLETPGHSPGGVSLLGEGFVLVGDALFAGSIGRTDLPGGSHGQLIRSIENKLLVLEEETDVLPGHGPETTIGREKRFNPFF